MSEAEELAKARLWVIGQRAIQASRIGVARTLQAPPGPAALVRAGFAPLVLALQEGREVAADRTEKVPALAGEPLSVTLSTPGPPGPQGIPGPQGPASQPRCGFAPLPMTSRAWSDDPGPGATRALQGGM